MFWVDGPRWIDDGDGNWFSKEDAELFRASPTLVEALEPFASILEGAPDGADRVQVWLEVSDLRDAKALLATLAPPEGGEV